MVTSSLAWPMPTLPLSQLCLVYFGYSSTSPSIRRSRSSCKSRCSALLTPECTCFTSLGSQFQCLHLIRCCSRTPIQSGSNTTNGLSTSRNSRTKVSASHTIEASFTLRISTQLNWVPKRQASSLHSFTSRSAWPSEFHFRTITSIWNLWKIQHASKSAWDCSSW